MKFTKNQKAIMGHTVGEPKRNWFGTNYGCKDSDDFELLVEAGYAEKRKAADWMGDDVLYFLTEKGQAAVKNGFKVDISRLSYNKERQAKTLCLLCDDPAIYHGPDGNVCEMCMNSSIEEGRTDRNAYDMLSNKGF